MCLWDRDFMEVEETFLSRGSGCVKGKIKVDSFNCAICVVYGPYHLEERRELWKELKNVKEEV